MVTVNWTAIVLLVMALFALAGFSKGWWREAIVTVFLAVLVLFLQVPAAAQFFIDAINAVFAFIWQILPDSIIGFLETTFGLGSAGLPPQIDAGSPQTWIIMLIVFIGLAILVGRLGLPGSARNAGKYNGYVVNLGGRLFGAMLGAINAWLIVSLIRAYLDGSNLPGGGGDSAISISSAATAPANAVMLQATNVPSASIADSFLPWLFGGLGLLVLIAAIKSRYAIQETKGFRKMVYKAPPGYQKAKVSSGGKG
jgi:hypothetical protein